MPSPGAGTHHWRRNLYVLPYPRRREPKRDPQSEPTPALMKHAPCFSPVSPLPYPLPSASVALGFAGKYPRTIRQRNVLCVDNIFATPGPDGIDANPVSGLQGVPLPAAPGERIRIGGFNLLMHDVAHLVRRIDEEPDVGVPPLDLCDNTFKGNGHVPVEVPSHGMMGKRGRREHGPSQKPSRKKHCKLAFRQNDLLTTIV